MIWMTLLALSGCQSDAGVTTYTTPPNASITSPPSGQGFEEGEVVTFQAAVDDAQDASETLQIQWTSDIDGSLYDGEQADADGFVEFQTANLSAGNHLITLTAIDSDAEKATDSIEVSITDLPDDPIIEILRPTSQDFGVEGEKFTFKAQVSDEQDPPGYLSVTLNSSYDGDFCTPAPGADGIVECDWALTVQDKSHLLTFTVTDADGFTGSQTAYFLVYAATAIDHDEDGFSEDLGDCDDDDPDIFPGADEVLNSEDDDCDETVDEGTAGYDDDGDGQSELDGDCDDSDPHSYPGASENCDAADNDCDTTVDEDTECYDDDGDGFTEEDGDCDDGNNGVNPDATETCDGIDNDCNGTDDDEGASGCDDWYIDADGDGYGDDSSRGACYCDATGSYTVENKDDCYDSNSSANPGQTGFFGVSRGDGSFDYNCDGSQEKELSDKAACADLLGVEVCGAGAYSAGWVGSTPSCGSYGNWGSDCDWWADIAGCEHITSSTQQACR